MYAGAQVYETPRRGPGFTDVPQPVRRVRQQRTDAPANSRPPNRESWYPRKPQPLFEQIEVHVTMTPDDEERGAHSLLISKLHIIFLVFSDPLVGKEFSDAP